MHKYLAIVDTGTGLDWMGLGVQPSVTDAKRLALVYVEPTGVVGDTQRWILLDVCEIPQDEQYYRFFSSVKGDYECNI